MSDVLDLNTRFTYHPPKGDQPIRYTNIRHAARMFAEVICASAPVSRERNLALTAVQEASMWANAAIACNE